MTLPIAAGSDCPPNHAGSVIHKGSARFGRTVCAYVPDVPGRTSCARKRSKEVRLRIGVSLNERGGPDALNKLTDDLRQAADDGFASAWMSNIFGLDALTALAVAGSRVPR